MTTADAVDVPDLRSSVEGPHELALAGLAGRDPDRLAAVAWCSAHLAAVDRVLYAAAEQRLPDGPQRVHDLRGIDQLVQQAVLRLDRRLTGDTHLSELPVDELADEVRVALREHADHEHALVDELQRVLDRAEQEALTDQLVTAMRHAPTRPHPHTPHTPLSGLVGYVDAGVDRVRDLMDNRVVPTPHDTRPPRVPGRWASYLMGVPYPLEDEPRP